jgi:hypothetical protein
MSKMLRAAIVGLCLGSAAAFMTPKTAKVVPRTVIANDFSGEIGVLPPTGEFEFIRDLYPRARVLP